MTGNDILNALLALKERNPAALDAVVYVCEAYPSDDFDNSGFLVVRVGHDINPDPDPDELGVIYIHARGIEECANGDTFVPGISNAQLEEIAKKHPPPPEWFTDAYDENPKDFGFEK